MLPSRRADSLRLADVISSSVASIQGLPNRLALPEVRSAIVVVIDGLGSYNLAARKGHARTLAQAIPVSNPLLSTFPSTTAVALTTLMTGVDAGQHGVVGYSVYDGETGRVLNQLTDWGAGMPPNSWQRAETVFERASTEGIQVSSVGHSKFANSGLTSAILRGSTYISADDTTERFAIAARLSERPGLVYLYVSELDATAHARGWESMDWLAALEQVDAAIARMLGAVGSDVGVFVTADHGIIDVPSHRQIALDSVHPGGFDGVLATAGDPRAFTFALHSDATFEERQAFANGWSERLGDTAWVVTREDVIAQGLFGAVDPFVVPRIADVFVLARKQVAFYDTRSGAPRSMSMIGQHGSISDEEVRVPALRFAGYVN